MKLNYRLACVFAIVSFLALSLLRQVGQREENSSSSGAATPSFATAEVNPELAEPLPDPRSFPADSPVSKDRAFQQMKRLMAGEIEVPVAEEEYAFDPVSQTALNPTHDMAIGFEADGSVSVSPLSAGDWNWSMRPNSGERISANEITLDRVERSVAPRIDGMVPQRRARTGAGFHSGIGEFNQNRERDQSPGGRFRY